MALRAQVEPVNYDQHLRSRLGPAGCCSSGPVVLQVDGKTHAADGRADDGAGSVFTSGSASSSAANPAHQSTVVVCEVTEAEPDQGVSESKRT